MIKILKSISYALQGIVFALKTQRNMKIHLLAILLVSIAAVYFKIASYEWLIILLFFALVVGLELINSALETLADKLHPEQDKKIGQMKDMSAGAVLVAAIFSVLAASIIFLPKILMLF